MTSLTSNGRVKLKDISRNAFILPADQAALDNLKKVPVLPQLLQQFNELAVDRMLYVSNTASAVRCGPRQFPTLYKLLKEACKVLDVPEPELYVRYHVVDNAYTAGIARKFIVICSPLVDTMNDEEMLFILGHELGHIKCEHLLYQMMGRVLIPLLDILSVATLGLGRIAGIGVVAAFYEWMRQAEYTCDRAGLLTCQNPRAALSATMKLGCGMTRLSEEMDVDAFLQQARDHADHKPEEGLAKALLFMLYKWQRTHPDVVFRAKMIDEWTRGGAYQEILDGTYPKVSDQEVG